MSSTAAAHASAALPAVHKKKASALPPPAAPAAPPAEYPVATTLTERRELGVRLQKELGLSMPAASKYIAQKGLYRSAAKVEEEM